VAIQTANASTAEEIDAVFAGFERHRPDAVLLAPDAFFASRVSQIAALSGRDKVPVAYSDIRFVRAGGLVSYRTDINDMFGQCASIPAGFSKAKNRPIYSPTATFAASMRYAMISRRRGIDRDEAYALWYVPGSSARLAKAKSNTLAAYAEGQYVVTLYEGYDFALAVAGRLRRA